MLPAKLCVEEYNVRVTVHGELDEVQTHLKYWELQSVSLGGDAQAIAVVGVESVL